MARTVTGNTPCNLYRVGGAGLSLVVSELTSRKSFWIIFCVTVSFPHFPRRRSKGGRLCVSVCRTRVGCGALRQTDLTACVTHCVKPQVSPPATPPTPEEADSLPLLHLSIPTLDASEASVFYYKSPTFIMHLQLDWICVIFG